jgi:enediyne core biosynthesis thioesterase
MNQHAPPRSVVSAPVARPRRYSYRHTISFEETNVVGNVYFTRHVSWQGRCRELFLRQYAPEILDDLKRELRLVTLNVSCEYFAEVHAFDEVEIQMWLENLRRHRIKLGFDYLLQRAGSEVLVARGFQEIGCMRQTADGLVPSAVPSGLAVTLAEFKCEGNANAQPADTARL